LSLLAAVLEVVPSTAVVVVRVVYYKVLRVLLLALLTLLLSVLAVRRHLWLFEEMLEIILSLTLYHLVHLQVALLLLEVVSVVVADK
jgi:hypothetical protein